MDIGLFIELAIPKIQKRLPMFTSFIDSPSFWLPPFIVISTWLIIHFLKSPDKTLKKNTHTHTSAKIWNYSQPEITPPKPAISKNRIREAIDESEDLISFKKNKEVENEILSALISKIINTSDIKKKPSPEVLSKILTLRPTTKESFYKIAGSGKAAKKISGLIIKEIIIFELCTSNQYFRSKRTSSYLRFFQDAVNTYQEIKISYNSGSGSSERVIRPVYMNSDYVWAKCYLRNELRCFKFINIKSYSKVIAKAG